MPKQRQRSNAIEEKPQELTKHSRLYLFAKEQEKNIIESQPGRRYALRDSATGEKTNEKVKQTNKSANKSQTKSRPLRAPLSKPKRALHQDFTSRQPTKPVESNTKWETVTANKERDKAPTASEEYVSNWLTRTNLGVVPPEEPKQLLIVPSSSEIEDFGTMASSSSVLTTTESGTNFEEQDKKSQTTQKPKITYKKLLQFRGIAIKESDDDQLNHLGLENISRVAQASLDEAAMNGFLAVLRTSLAQGEASMNDKDWCRCFKVFESTKQRISNWSPEKNAFRRFPSVCSEDFNFDIEHCMTSSEADFQRTIMMSLIDRYDFRNIFTYSCEEQWTMESNHVIQPQGQPNKISQPKPDLAISFYEDALWAPDRIAFPVNLSKYLSPGNKGDERWFPFFFMEAKKADHSLQHAEQRNLNSASQALFNMYQWIKPYDDLTVRFFNEVRTFSIVLNAKIICLRMHRAVQTEKRGLTYEFTELEEINNYDRLSACHLVKSVLVDYAQEKLLPILRDAFQRVAKNSLGDQHQSNQLPKSQSAKRKSRDENGHGVANTEHRNEDPMATDLDDTQRVANSTGTSFAMDNLHVTGDNENQSKAKKRRGRKDRG